MSAATVPVHISRDRTLRVKIIDACGLACTFCHNEGTPVTTDNQRRPPGQFTGTGRSGRVSIYAETNGASFLAAPVPADDGFAEVLAQLRDALDLCELHLTGGEPTVHPAVAKLVRIGVDAGYAVRMTSNGENGAAVLAACADSGLSKVNFSIFGTTPGELAAVQHARYQNASLAERKIEALRRSIALCIEHGIQANANLVLPGPDACATRASAPGGVRPGVIGAAAQLARPGRGVGAGHP